MLIVNGVSGSSLLKEVGLQHSIFFCFSWCIISDILPWFALVLFRHVSFSKKHQKIRVFLYNLYRSVHKLTHSNTGRPYVWSTRQHIHVWNVNVSICDSVMLRHKTLTHWSYFNWCVASACVYTHGVHHSHCCGAPTIQSCALNLYRPPSGVVTYMYRHTL